MGGHHSAGGDMALLRWGHAAVLVGHCSAGGTPLCWLAPALPASVTAPYAEVPRVTFSYSLFKARGRRQPGAAVFPRAVPRQTLVLKQLSLSPCGRQGARRVARLVWGLGEHRGGPRATPCDNTVCRAGPRRGGHR